DIAKKKENFKTIEAKAFSKLRNYTHFSFSGIRIAFIPAAIEVFFPKKGLSTDSTGFIDSVDELKIIKNQKGRGVFDSDADSSFRFSRYLLVLGGFIVMVWGFGTFRSRDLTLLYASMCSYRKIFAYTLLSRFIIMTALLLALFGLTALILVIEGIGLKADDISGMFVFFAVSLLMLFFLFLIGVLAGLIKNRDIGTFVFAMAYFSLVLLIPGAMSHIVKASASSIIDNSSVRLNKMKIIEDFENMSLEVLGKFNLEKIDDFRKMMDKYIDEYYLMLEKLEIAILADVSSNAKLSSALSLCTPVGFYSMTCSDLCSRGMENSIEMHRYLIELQRKLVLFYIARTFYGERPLKLVPFINGDENIFLGQSRLPRLFAFGFGINVGYFLLLLLTSFLLFRRNLFPANQRTGNYPEVETPLKSGEHTWIQMEDRQLYGQYLNTFYGTNSKFAGRVTLDGESLVSSSPVDFILLPGIASISDNANVLDFFDTAMSMGGFSGEQKHKFARLFIPWHSVSMGNIPAAELALLLLEFARIKGSKIIILNDFFAGLDGAHHAKLLGMIKKLEADNRCFVQINHRSMHIIGRPTNNICYRLADGKFIDIRK
ncbi:MAG: hypothetical protein GY765_42675, partial [bacterium]|nr:hypothetical protein [bacterium]